MKPPLRSSTHKTYTYGVTVEQGGAVLFNGRLPMELHPGLGGIEEAARRGAAVAHERRPLPLGAELRVTIQPPDRREAATFAATRGAGGWRVTAWREQLDIEAWLRGAQG